MIPLREQLRDLSPVELPRQADLAVTLLIPARHSGHALEHTVNEAHRFLTKRYPASFEIILIPNSAPNSARTEVPDRSFEIAKDLARKLPHVLVTPHDEPVGKGAALRTGFVKSRGKWIFFTDADLPYDLDFFDGAARRLEKGYDLVTGNRRLATSHFDIPVSLLPLAYGRHRLGLFFNRIVRLLLPIRTIDTQAGIKAMSRKLAFEAFSRQRCPGFFFDLELLLAARGAGLDACELPVTLYLNSEKSTVRLLRETLLASFWIGRIRLRNFAHAYGRPPRKPGVARRYLAQAGLSLGTRVFLALRWLLTPYGRIAAALPAEGRILDLGCGHGLLALTAALGTPSREVAGVDHDEKRIAAAKTAGTGLPNLSFRSGSMTELPAQSGLAAISMIDVLHYFSRTEQVRLIGEASSALAPGGLLLAREVDPDDGWVAAWNRLYERIATGVGFTRAAREELSFRSRADWITTFENAGFRVRAERCSSALFADVLFHCTRPLDAADCEKSR